MSSRLCAAVQGVDDDVLRREWQARGVCGDDGEKTVLVLEYTFWIERTETRDVERD